jgi:hypothetical protein
MKDCLLKILLIAIVYMQHWWMVAPFSTKPNVHVNKQSALNKFYLGKLEGERGNSDRESNDRRKKEKGYLFGFVTRNVFQAFQSKVNSLTGKKVAGCIGQRRRSTIGCSLKKRYDGTRHGLHQASLLQGR